MKGRERSMAIRTGINKQGWEKSDFPVACDKCYGENPYMRMLKEDYGQECRICFRPFTVFKWKGNKGIYKRTHICQSCSKEKNLCQVCTLDLEFGLPMEVRDKRCGENGKYLLNDKFISEENRKIKPPPPPGPPPSIKQNPVDKELVYIPEKDSDQEDMEGKVAEVLVMRNLNKEGNQGKEEGEQKEEGEKNREQPSGQKEEKQK